MIGVAGALGGGWLATKLFHVHTLHGFFNLSTWLTAIAGAAVLLLAYHRLPPGEPPPQPPPDRLGAPVNGEVQPAGISHAAPRPTRSLAGAGETPRVRSDDIFCFFPNGHVASPTQQGPGSPG